MDNRCISAENINNKQGETFVLILFFAEPVIYFIWEFLDANKDGWSDRTTQQNEEIEGGS